MMNLETEFGIYGSSGKPLGIFFKNPGTLSNNCQERSVTSLVPQQCLEVSTLLAENSREDVTYQETKEVSEG